MNNKKSFGILELYQLIMQRKKERDPSSEVYRWLTRGEIPIGKKVVEEAVEAVLASHDSDRERVCSELCDLLFFAFIMASFHDIDVTDIEKKLADRHEKPPKAARSDKTINLSMLDNYRYESRFTVNDMCSKIGLDPEETEQFIKSNQVIIFSHNFRKQTLSQVQRTGIFPRNAKNLKNDLQNDLKVKLALPRDTAPVFTPRRRVQEWIFPVVVITDILVLPLLVSILAADVKEYIDGLSRRKLNLDEVIELDFCVRGNSTGEERWIRIKGKAKQVYQILVFLLESTKQ